MTKPDISTSVPAPVQAATGRLFVLDLSGARVFTLNADGSDAKTIVTGGRHPDGIVVDAEAGHIYWTNMGVPNLNDGSIERADLDGRNRKTIIPEGATFTPKQLHLQRRSGKLYWSDREGMRVMRANLDGSQIETLVQTGSDAADRSNQENWCVGIAVDPDRGHIYWTQKGGDDANRGRILRANLEIPEGQTAANRGDITVLFDGLPEPIDLELDLTSRVLYWTDRGDPPRGNTVNRSPIDGPPNQEIVLNHLMEGIGIALDVRNQRMFVTDLGGNIWTGGFDGTGNRPVRALQGNLTGIAYAEVPERP